MSFSRVLSLLVLLGALSPVQAQQPAATPAGAGADTAAAQPPARPEWRDVSGYRFPAVAKTVADMQNLAYAMQLRDLCANPRVPDNFVRERLDRFGAMTGREENCQTLLDY